jgi:hypothetical protein
MRIYRWKVEIANPQWTTKNDFLELLINRVRVIDVLSETDFVMKRYLLLLSIAISLTSPVKATIYYSVGDGGWTGSIWSSSCSTCTPGTALPTLVDGDIIIIDDQVTISSGAVTIAPSITVIIRTDLSPNTATNPAKLIFTNGGKLALTSSSSKVKLENLTGNTANNPVIDGTQTGGSNQISIGGIEYWRGSNGDVKGVGTLQPGGALPITLISFTAMDVEHSIHLKWVTAMERNFSHFELEKSNGNLNFIPIARIEGKGGLEVITAYNYLDSLPQSGKNYYRLKSVDYDHTFEYSPVVVAHSKTEKQIVVFPNPTAEGNISVRTNFSPQEGDRIEIYNSLGLKLQEFNIIEYENVLPFNDTIKQGSYLLRYVSPTHSQVVRFYSR